MKIITQSWDWVQKPTKTLQIIEKAGRTCYKTENKITDDSANKFVKMILDVGHESVIEHVYMSIRFITNRGVTHELVRHRLCSFSQESTRYVTYTGNMEFIKPVWWKDATKEQKDIFIEACNYAENYYLQLLNLGWKAQQAREVLPNALKTEIVVTANVREWRHIFKLRCSKAAHPQIRELMIDCLKSCQKDIPIIFDNIL